MTFTRMVLDRSDRLAAQFRMCAELQNGIGMSAARRDLPELEIRKALLIKSLADCKDQWDLFWPEFERWKIDVAGRGR